MLKTKLKKTWPFFLILLLSIFAFWPLLRGGFFPVHDDLQVVRLFEMEKCFLDGQLPCRWTPDLGGGFGLPMFNYYSPLVYYLGMIFRFLGFSFLGSIKLLFLAGILLSGFSMFLLAREFWGNLGGLVSAILYVFVPYHALDIYVRGDLAEFFALSFLPLVFWCFYRLIKEKSSQFLILSAFSLATLILSHNITAMLSFPILVIWILYWFSTLEKFNRLAYIKVFSAGFLGFSLSAFFLLPALFENSLVNLLGLTTGYFDFRAHFITLGQLFLDRSWDFGASWFGPIDGLSFQIGWPHWWLVVLSGGIGLWRLKNRKDGTTGLIFLTAGLFLILAFMTHSRSIFIWEKIPFFSFVQFPWRLVGLAAFSGSFLAGSVIGLFARRNQVLEIFLVAFLIVLTILLNFAYFKPAKFQSVTDQDLLPRKDFFDFLPKNASLPEASFQEPKIIEGEGQIREFFKKSDYFKVNIEVYQDQKASILIPVFNFPNWEIFVDEQKVLIEENQFGLIAVKCPPGKHEISGWFRNTKVRLLGNGITLISLFFLIFYLAAYEKNSKKAIN